MNTLVDQIELYLKQRLDESTNGILELRRSDLAEAFTCVPSQINYVLETRFNSYQGYLVESRRGGGGYLRIIRLSRPSGEWQQLLAAGLDTRVSPSVAQSLLGRLAEEGFLSGREAMLVGAMIDDNVLKKQSPEAEVLRGALLNALLLCLLREDMK